VSRRVWVLEKRKPGARRWSIEIAFVGRRYSREVLKTWRRDSVYEWRVVPYVPESREEQRDGE
jgi:hypothetical protein